MEIKDELKLLQRSLAEIDLLHSPRASSRNGFTELLLLKMQNMKFKMYQEPNHKMPHIHIDYGKKNHAASFSIKPPKRLEGSLSIKYNKVIVEWISNNREVLLKIWATIQSGNDPKKFIMTLTN